MEALNKERVKATFFLIGNRVAANAAIVRKLADSGQDIGNHSWAHPNFLKLNPTQIQQEISQTQVAIITAGAPAPHLFRPPYGSFTGGLLPYVGMPVILWNVDPKDWSQKDPAAIVQAVETQAKPGAIIVMHDHPTTAAAVGKIVHDLKGKYQFVTVTKLLNLKPDSVGEFIGR
jgi:peptidoglycan/xylan/chitin deacetylase (PgdA/CDA1 family)